MKRRKKAQNRKARVNRPSPVSSTLTCSNFNRQFGAKIDFYSASKELTNTHEQSNSEEIKMALHILGQPDKVWCRIQAPRSLKVHAVVLQTERRPISQNQLVGWIKKKSWMV